MTTCANCLNPAKWISTRKSHGPVITCTTHRPANWEALMMVPFKEPEEEKPVAEDPEAEDKPKKTTTKRTATPKVSTPRRRSARKTEEST